MGIIHKILEINIDFTLFSHFFFTEPFYTATHSLFYPESYSYISQNGTS
ncbi:hypothetical protein HCCG_01626 [Helicobacter cinaedi CCUG 18818 = ATCC BAA-847]|uniref:Uncharacterized protein n=1 Tax=Helicobacter cinaedi CCUG 18818 = ATCC BAA-847 TaxID=537971 RepID=A0ABN0BBT1_9HELI|nr:hypothetical protein HCCG_01626 [Helicobacter cinaedi CCUG 18818 = ATCC BAA-847]